MKFSTYSLLITSFIFVVACSRNQHVNPALSTTALNSSSSDSATSDNAFPDGWHYTQLPNTNIEIPLPITAIVNETKLGKAESLHVAEQGIKIQSHKTNAEGYSEGGDQYFGFLIRKLRAIETIEKYLELTPDRTSLSTVNGCESDEKVEANDLIIYRIKKCSYGGFLPKFFISANGSFYDINLVDDGAELNKELVDKAVFGIRLKN